eukprot:TRINITY_DN3215_c0_g1_i1.p1 TRINITY_DN3215_c0_g1~~TRINITY_DN3215_c0_g1_i1.p1  ORF type:complete len:2193 (-),score=411.22 TRINITY_DN3215_c0_g1_i1:88-6666(-)
MTVQEETWEPVEMEVPGEYRLCWCVDTTWDYEKRENQALCGAGYQFAVDAGMLIVKGTVVDQEYPCVAFRACRLFVWSQLPFEQEDRIMVVSAGPFSLNSVADSCGSKGNSGVIAKMKTNKAALEAANSTASHLSLVQNTSQYVGEFELPSAGMAGRYRVCYCKNSAQGPCDTGFAFRQYAGILKTSGGGIQLGDPVTKRCLALATCRFNITGVWAMQISYYDRFQAIPMGKRCGSQLGSIGGSSGLYPVFEMDAKKLLPSGEWFGDFSHDWRAAYKAGDYRVCFCQAMQTAQGECIDASDFGQDVARLHVLGAMMSTDWECQQGSFCKIVVPGWRVGPGDRLRLILPSAACGKVDDEDHALGEGFDNNPATSIFAENASLGVLLHFDLGRARGSGSWKVCLCVQQASWSGGCKTSQDFAQEIGQLSISGLLESVQVTREPATVSMASVLVKVIKPGASRSVFCAVSSQNLTEAPTSVAVMTCAHNIPGCLGFAPLAWRAEVGWNTIHVPLDAAKARAAGAEDGKLPKAHVWCTGDLQLCSTGRCAMPPLGRGLEIDLRPGATAGMHVRAILQHPVELKVAGDGVNALGGWLEIAWEHNGCPKVGQTWEQRPAAAIPLGQPTWVAPLRHVTWYLSKAPTVGMFALCWCDRSYGSDCAYWENIGSMMISGPIGVSVMPEFVEPNEAFNVTIRGVNLTMQEPEDRLFAVSKSEGCSLLAKEEVDKRSIAASGVSVNGSSAQFRVRAPSVAGIFVLCWVRGRNSSTPPLQLAAQGLVRESRDCVLGSWEAAVSADVSTNSSMTTGSEGLDLAASTCTRVCGGGLYKLHRRIVVEAMGGGQPCPALDHESRTRWEPCNMQPCPSASVDRALTEPQQVLELGQAFKVFLRGKKFDPTEDRIILMRGADAECGEVQADDDSIRGDEQLLPAMLADDWSSTAGGAPGSNMTPNDTDVLNRQAIVVNGTTTTIPQTTAPILHGGGARCNRYGSNSSHLECGDGFHSLRVFAPGFYRICFCDASSVIVTYLNASGLLELSRERCSRLSDYKILPLNGSLIEIVDPHAGMGEGTSETIGVDTGVSGLVEGVQHKRSDSLLVIGLVSAALLYCCAVFVACWYWRWRRRKQGAELRRRGSRKGHGTGIISNSLVARATQRAWDAYVKTVVEQHQLSSGDEEPMGVEVADEAARPSSGQGQVSGSLTPPGTGLSLKTTSTASTRAGTPGSRMSLLKVTLNQDMRPATPVKGGSFLDLPLTGKGSRTPLAVTRPTTGASLASYEEKQTTPPAGSESSSGENSRVDTPQEKEQPCSVAAARPELKLPGLEAKLEKLKAEQDYFSSEDDEESSASPPARGSLVPAPPSLAPPPLPGQLDGCGARQPAKLPPSQKPKPHDHTPRQAPPEESPRHSTPRAPTAPATQLPAMALLRPLLPPPPPPAVKQQQVVEVHREAVADASTMQKEEDDATAAKQEQVQEVHAEEVTEAKTVQKEEVEESVEDEDSPVVMRTGRLYSLVKEKVIERHTPRLLSSKDEVGDNQECKVETGNDDAAEKLAEQSVCDGMQLQVEPRMEDDAKDKEEPLLAKAAEKAETEEDVDIPAQVAESNAVEHDPTKSSAAIIEDTFDNKQDENRRRNGEEPPKQTLVSQTDAQHDPQEEQVTLEKDTSELENKKRVSPKAESTGPRLSNWMSDMKSRLTKKPGDESKPAPTRGLRSGKLAPSPGFKASTLKPTLSGSRRLLSKPSQSTTEPDPSPPAPTETDHEPEVLQPAPLPPTPTETDHEPEVLQPAPFPPEVAQETAASQPISPTTEPAPLPPLADPLPPEPALPSHEPVFSASESSLCPLPFVPAPLPPEAPQVDFQAKEKKLEREDPPKPNSVQVKASPQSAQTRSEEDEPDSSSVALAPIAELAEDDLEIVKCYTPSAQRGKGPPPAPHELPPAWGGGYLPEPEPAVPSGLPQEAAKQEEADLEAQFLGSAARPPKRPQLPTGSFEDAQEQLEREWYEKLAAGVAADAKPRRGASLRGAGGRRLGNASLRSSAASAAASAAGSVVGSSAPSRASFSPGNSPRDLPEDDRADGPRLDAESTNASPSLGPVPTRGPGPPMGPGPSFGAGLSFGPGPAFGPGPSFGPGPAFGPGQSFGPGAAFGPGPSFGPGPGFGPGRGPSFGPGAALGPGPGLGGPPGRARRGPGAALPGPPPSQFAFFAP